MYRNVITMGFVSSPWDTNCLTRITPAKIVCFSENLTGALCQDAIFGKYGYNVKSYRLYILMSLAALNISMLEL